MKNVPDRSSGQKMLPVLLRSAGVLLLLAAGSGAEQLRFDTAREWRQWALPLGAVEVTRAGVIRPVPARKNINAVRNATQFGGGIVGAGSNLGDAAWVMDGDGTTGWRPVPDDPAEEKWIELDLGRVVLVRQIRLRFDENAPPFEIFDLFLSNGERTLDNALVPLPDAPLVYRVKQRFKENDQHRVLFELEDPRGAMVQFVRLQVLRADAEARLTEVEVEAWGDNLTLGLMERGGTVDINLGSEGNNIPLAGASRLIDGNLNTFWHTVVVPRGAADIFAHITLDLGAVYGVDMIRLASIVSTAPWRASMPWFWTREFFDFNFYEILTSDGSFSPDGTLRWQKHFSGWPSTTNRRQGVVDHLFPLQATRFVRVQWKIWDATCAEDAGGGDRLGTAILACNADGLTEELFVFGEGYPRQVSLRSPILDMEGQKNVNALNWRGDTPAGTRLEIRSRSGNALREEYIFRDKNGKEVTEKVWNRLIPSFRGPVDTAFSVGDDWSPWSRLYWASGQGFLSPSLRRYAQLEVRLISEDGQAAAALERLSLDFSDPLAEGVVGEVFPIQVEPGKMQAFSYFLQAASTAAGFDRVAVEASTPLHFVQARLDGEPVAVEIEPREPDFKVRFPRPVRAGELVELRFEGAVYVHGTRFDAFLENSALTEPVRQRVEAGDATDQVESSTNVVGLPLGNDLFANLSVQSGVLTPNGDGHNDALVVGVDLVNVLEGRPLRLRLFDLSGRRVWAQEKEGMAGPQAFVWDGRDGSGRRVPPGHYILRIEMEGDARHQTLTRLVRVVY